MDIWICIILYSNGTEHEMMKKINANSEGGRDV
jgi:hypothetical protein